jgi:hypothetical protein
MGYASKLGRARISATNPQAAAICDRCGFVFNHVDLGWQYDYAGTGLVNKRILVCERCDDVPQTQLKVIVLPPDPVPIINPRTQDYHRASTTFRVTSGQDTINQSTGIPVPGSDNRITEDKDFRIIENDGDYLFDPKVEEKTRITSTGDRRTTQIKDARITQKLPVKPPIPRRIAITKVRVTDKGDTRITVETDRRITEPLDTVKRPIEE